MHAELILVVAAGAALVAVGGGLWLVRGTTAVPAVVWAAAGAAAFLFEALLRNARWLDDPASQSVMRLLGASLAVCPTMSLLGAKRPQHGVWQFIVATLAFVLSLPALSALLVRPGSLPDVHLLERGFFAALLIVGWMNFVATRHGLAATLVTAGLAGLMRGFLPGSDPGLTAIGPVDLVAAGSVACGAMLAAGQSAWAPARTRPASGAAAAIDRPFLALRETLGAAWTLRIAERFNAAAADRGWPCRLQFGGLAVTGDPGPAGWEADAVRCCRALLRRFVSPRWLERHGGLGKSGRQASWEASCVDPR
jgi:hypothetical protein